MGTSFLVAAWLLKQTFVAILLKAHLIALAFAKEGLLVVVVVVVEEEGLVEKIDGLALVVVHTYTILTWPFTVSFFVSLHPNLP